MCLDHWQRSQHLTAAEKTVYAGIDIGGTNIKFGLVDSDGHVVYRRQRPTMAQKGPTPLMHLVTNIAESLLLYAAEEDHHINWLGVGTPGAVDFRTGVGIGPCPNIKGWQGMDIGPRLKERLNMSITTPTWWRWPRRDWGRRSGQNRWCALPSAPVSAAA